MVEYKQGGVVPEMIGQPDGVRFTMDEAGAMMLFQLRHPDAQERANIEQGAPLRMGLFVRDEVMIILAKAGNLSWWDAPFWPAPGSVPAVEEQLRGDATQGMAMIVLLVDTADGTIVNKPRLVGLPNALSKDLVDAARRIAAGLPDRADYLKRVDRLYAGFSTRQMVDAVRTYRI